MLATFTNPTSTFSRPLFIRRRRSARLKKGTLKLIPSCGHLPHVE